MKNYISMHSPQRRSGFDVLPPSTSQPSTGWLLQSVIEGLPDGILIVTEDAAIASSNSRARTICQQLNALSDSVNGIPQAIWNICAPLLDASHSLPAPVAQVDAPMVDAPMVDTSTVGAPVVEDTIRVAESALIRVRARWLAPVSSRRLLVMLEDKYLSAHQQAMVESVRCGLTPREAEVFLYRCLGYTYDDIACKLYITVNTVKKHVKSINMKRDTDTPKDGSAW